MDNAFAGDIIGVSDSGQFQIGDTVSTTKRLECEDIPKFTPELFAKLSVSDAMKRQKLQKGLKELSEEGAIQLFIDPAIGPQDAIIGVVGELHSVFSTGSRTSMGETRLCISRGALAEKTTSHRWSRA